MICDRETVRVRKGMDIYIFFFFRNLYFSTKKTPKGLKRQSKVIKYKVRVVCLRVHYALLTGYQEYIDRKEVIEWQFMDMR